MGQRHQVYVRLPKVYYNPDNPNNRGEVTVGIHHQWLWGGTAIRSLKNFLTLISSKFKTNYPAHKDTNYFTFENLLSCSYSLDFESGYYHGTCGLQEEWVNRDKKNKKGQSPECLNPTKGDNNNGITVVDLTGEKPTYCFMAIRPLECIHGDKREAYDEFYPISVSEWVALHYGDNWTTEKVNLDNTHNTKDIESWVHFIETNFDLITPQRLMEIFPSIEKDIENGIKNHERRSPNSVKFIKEGE